MAYLFFDCSQAYAYLYTFFEQNDCSFESSGGTCISGYAFYSSISKMSSN